MAGKKPLTGAKLLKYLLDLQERAVDLSKLTINFRSDRDSDVEVVKVVEMDLYDESNKTLESICLIADPREV